MKKGEHYIATVERVDFPNKGIAHVNETTCVIKNTIPGQEIEFSVSKKRESKIEGRIVNVLKKAPNELESPCPVFGNCGGCTYLNLPYEDQLKLKENQVKRLLESVLSKQEEEYEFLPIKGSPAIYEYRNKMEFSFGDEYKDGPMCLGMHKRGSFHDVVDASCCVIVDDDYRAILDSTRNYFEDVPFYHKITHSGIMRHLLIRKAKRTGQILIALVTTSTPLDKYNKSIDEWKDEILNLKLTDGASIRGILHIVNDSLADAVCADKVISLYGDEYITEELLGLKFNISTFSFFQTNSLGAEVLYETAREFIGDLGKEDAVVFDLYSGTGTIAQLMAKVAGKVIGVEIVPEAVEAARENAMLNGLHNCEFIADDVLKALDTIEEKPDFIILDPPRDGVNPKALKKIIDYGVDRLIYISCKPTSLSRDLESFYLAGYHVDKVQCVDQFPQTFNIETVVLLNNKFAKAKDFVQIGIDAEDYYRIKDAKRNE